MSAGLPSLGACALFSCPLGVFAPIPGRRGRVPFLFWCLCRCLCGGPCCGPGSSPGSERVVVGCAAVSSTAHSVGVAPSPHVIVPSFPCVGSRGRWTLASAVPVASGPCFGGASWRACASGSRASPARGGAVLVLLLWRALPMCAPWCPSFPPSPSVPRPLVLPPPGPLVVSCPRVVSPLVLRPCGCLPATSGLSSPPCRGVLSLPLPFPCPCPFSSRCGGAGAGGVYGALMAHAWGWVVCSHQRRGAGVWRGRTPWTQSQRRASHASCGMVASGAALLGSVGVRVRTSWKVCTMCTPSRLPAPPAHFTERRSSRKSGADHQVRWAGAWGGWWLRVRGPGAAVAGAGGVQKGADHTSKVGQWTTSSSTTLTTHCSLQQCASSPNPCKESERALHWLATAAQRRCVRLHFHRGANRARDFFAMASQ